jgi:hypothetical protein
MDCFTEREIAIGCHSQRKTVPSISHLFIYAAMLAVANPLLKDTGSLGTPELVV